VANLSLAKLPWYGQVGAFAVLAIGGIGAFIYYYDMPARAEIKTRQDQLVMLQKDITRGQNTARKLPEFEKEVSQLEARLTALSAVLVDRCWPTSAGTSHGRIGPREPRETKAHRVHARLA